MINRKNKLKIGVSCVAFLGLFMIGYNYATNKINNNEKQEAEVYTDGQKVLKNNLLISLYTDGLNDKTLTVESFKKEYGIEKELTEENLKEALEKLGYEIKDKNDEVFTFVKKIEEKEKNKYYIGENNGYFAIFKVDENGKMVVVTEYETMVDNIPLSDKERKQIKDKTFFSSKNLEEVEEEISGLTT